MRVRDIFLSGIGAVIPETETVGSAVERGAFPAEKVANLGFTAAAVAGDRPAPDMALEAARAALKTSGLSPTELVLLVYADVWYQGPEGWGPQYHLQKHLVGDDLLAFELKHGCNGMFSGMELAVGALRAEPHRRAAMVVGADNFGTPLMERWNPGTGLVVLGDGASAVVLAKDSGFARLLSICTASFTDMEEAYRAGEPMMPPGITVGRVLDFVSRLEAFKEKMVAEGIGWTMGIRHHQRYIEIMHRALEEAEVEAADIKRVIVHNLAEEEVEPYLGVLGFTMDQSTWDFGSTIGHIGVNDHVLSLHHLLSTGEVGPGDHILMCGFAAGVTYKAAVVQILAMPSLAD
ncbi:ketoacyl-ACP synthase III family protein [Actinomadura sp. 9N215]|uniref:ketoacyl-ACP synthase III family protein n=1 Tax=Actinomadura sp. 9N215 TaxID=3375150 RepID=UPI0037BC8E78